MWSPSTFQIPYPYKGQGICKLQQKAGSRKSQILVSVYVGRYRPVEYLIFG